MILLYVIVYIRIILWPIKPVQRYPHFSYVAEKNSVLCHSLAFIKLAFCNSLLIKIQTLFVESRCQKLGAFSPCISIMKALSINTTFQKSRSNSVFGSSTSSAFAYRFKITNYPTKISYPPLVLSSYSSKICNSALSTTAPVVEENQTFDADKGATLVKELRNVFSSGRTKSYVWRMSQLKSIAKMLEEKEKEITDAIYKDLSKPYLEAFISEISQAKSSCNLALKELDSWMKPEKVETSISTYPSSAEIVSEPLGVVLVISTWNFPFLLSLDPVIGAISAGNAVVLKPSEISPATSSVLAKLFEEYLDRSAIKVVEGAVPETTALLEQRWDKILYTGSARVGRIVMAAAAKHLTPVVLELGGKCPAVVDSDINLQIAARRIIAGKWALNNGQACIAVDYIITTKEFAPKLVQSLKAELELCFGQSPIHSKDLSRIVSPPQFARLSRFLDEVSDKIVLGGQRDESQLRIAPTVLLDVPNDAMVMKEEIFGPLIPIVTVEKIEDSFEVIKSKEKPLSAYLFTENEELKKAFVQNISSGGMLVNDTVLHLTVDGLPFGGVGESGMGSYHGKFSFDTFSHKKSVMYRSFAIDAPVRYPPYTPEKLKALIGGNLGTVILALLGW